MDKCPLAGAPRFPELEKAEREGELVVKSINGSWWSDGWYDLR